MDALILCGGFATRLEPITLFVPKPLLPINGRPILDYTIDNVVSNGAKRIVVSTNQKFANQFEYWKKNIECVKGLKNLEMVTEPTMHNGEKYGAIRGIQHAIETLGISDDLLIVAGDNFYDFNLSALLDHFNRTRKPILVTYDIKSLDEAKRFGVVTLDGDRIVDFQEKPQAPASTKISTGIYAFPKEMLHKFSEYLGDNNNPDAPGYFLQWLIKRAEIESISYTGKWYDVGNIDTYKEVFDLHL